MKGVCKWSGRNDDGCVSDWFLSWCFCIASFCFVCFVFVFFYVVLFWFIFSKSEWQMGGIVKRYMLQTENKTSQKVKNERMKE